jgi:hypothetical protein
MQRDSTERKIGSAVKVCKVASRRKVGGVAEESAHGSATMRKVIQKNYIHRSMRRSAFSLVIKWKSKTILTLLKMHTPKGRSDVKSLSVIR